ncbi:unnamed protein product [Closterium sp. Naga37s-1]|nr:unnamed protein product [Closterium sp. Naga37s-1]
MRGVYCAGGARGVPVAGQRIQISPAPALLSPLSAPCQVPGALSPEECAEFIAQAERVGFQWQGSGGPAKGEAYRDNHRISVEDNELAGESGRRKRRDEEGIGKSTHLWDRLAPVLQPLQAGNRKAVRLNPNMRVYRYSRGQQFGAHIDESVTVAGGGRTEYTLLVYLSGAPSTWEGREEWEEGEGYREEGEEQGEGGVGAEGDGEEKGERDGEGAVGEGAKEGDGGEGRWRREKGVAGGRGKGGVGKQQHQHQEQLVGGETVFYVGARSQESFENSEKYHGLAGRHSVPVSLFSLNSFLHFPSPSCSPSVPYSSLPLSPQVSPEVGMALLHSNWARCLLHEASEVKLVASHCVYAPLSPHIPPLPFFPQVSPEVGMPSLHRHGARCLLHEAREVKAGIKSLVCTFLYASPSNFPAGMKLSLSFLFLHSLPFLRPAGQGGEGWNQVTLLYLYFPTIPPLPISLQVSPEVGMVLLHRHGARCLLHEAMEVKAGIKYVLHSDVVFK